MSQHKRNRLLNSSEDTCDHKEHNAYIHAFGRSCDIRFPLLPAANASTVLVSCEVAGGIKHVGALQTGIAGHLYDWMAWKRSGASISRSMMKRHTRLLSLATSPWWPRKYISVIQTGNCNSANLEVLQVLS